MKVYENPVVRIVSFSVSDVIAASGYIAMNEAIDGGTPTAYSWGNLDNGSGLNQ